MLICDNDADHSFTLEGGLRNSDFEEVIITDATELVKSAQNLWPVAILVNPEMTGFNAYEVCKHLMTDGGIPFMLLLPASSTHRASIGNCRADDVVTKPAKERDNVANLINKLMSLHKSNP